MIPDRRRRRVRGFLARLTWPLRRAPWRAKDQRAYDLGDRVDVVQEEAVVTPQRVQRTRRKGLKGMPEGAKYVGRPTKFGNPYKAGEFGDIVAFTLFCGTARGIWDPTVAAKLDDRAAGYAYQRHVAWLKRIDRHPVEVIQAELAGWDLACWCELDFPWCHVGPLLAIARGA